MSRQQGDHAAFGPWLARHLVNADPPITRPELATRLGINTSTISRWINGDTQPDFDKVTRLADILDVPAGELYTLAGYGTPTDVAAAIANLRPLHPLAAEVNDMLDPDSPLPPEERQAIEKMLELIVASRRRDMRKRRTA